MVFSSYEFLFGFLPVVLVGYYLLSMVSNGIWQKLFLLGASLFFYGYSNINYLFLILASVTVNYLTAIAIQSRRDDQQKLRILLLTVGVLFNVGLLGYYKYFDFFLTTINELAGTDFVLHNILLPLGISFFTFQQLSFLISVYKKEEKADNPLNYSLFATFFPQLVAGPIVLYEEMIPQFSDPRTRKFQADNFARGLYIFAVGLFKKAVIADTLAVFVDNGFEMSSMGLLGGWITALSYTLQIYFDFSGYSDMAIGLGAFFNIRLPDNFDTPYLSESITVFWRRWHITLGRALGTYVYKPLGGNRHGLGRTCVNLFLTFLVSGLWHGASWTFLVWGVIQGVIVVVERVGSNLLVRIPRVIRIAATFLTTNFLWVLFRAESFENAADVYRAMLNFGDLGYANLSALAMDGIVSFPTAVNAAAFLLLFGCLMTVILFGRERVRLREGEAMTGAHLSIAVAFFALSVLCMGRESVFIYYNF